MAAVDSLGDGGAGRPRPAVTQEQLRRRAQLSASAKPREACAGRLLRGGLGALRKFARLVAQTRPAIRRHHDTGVGVQDGASASGVASGHLHVVTALRWPPAAPLSPSGCEQVAPTTRPVQTMADVHVQRGPLRASVVTCDPVRASRATHAPRGAGRRCRASHGGGHQARTTAIDGSEHVRSSGSRDQPRQLARAASGERTSTSSRAAGSVAAARSPVHGVRLRARAAHASPSPSQTARSV